MNKFLQNEFIFSPRYRVWRHLIYWTFHINIWAAFWVFTGTPLSYGRQLINMTMWVPAFIVFGYPLVYGAIPHLLLKGRVVEFFVVLMGWGAVGLYIDEAYRSYVLIPAQEAMGLTNILPRGPLAFCYLCMTTSAASPMIIRFFKLWTIKQRDWLQAQQEKITAELQLLKSQVRPHFLFNTLNNIYSFALDESPKTPEMITKLSSLLHYMLHDCRSDQVKLEKEIDIMRNYVDLEKERYGTNLKLSWNVQGEIRDKYIAPLLMLPFLENAFKHGTSEQLGKPWLVVEISMLEDSLLCRFSNSKDEGERSETNGIGINNVKKRLELIYSGRYELNIEDEGDFFVVQLQLRLSQVTKMYIQKTAPANAFEPAPAYN